MPTREFTPRARFQVSFESSGDQFVCKRKIRLNPPRFVFGSMRTLPRVMLFQSAFEIISRTNVMPTVILDALQDISVVHSELLTIFSTKLARRAGVPGPLGVARLRFSTARHQPTPRLSGDSPGVCWWRRGESNPCPERHSQRHLHV